jgi:hypothetical protein
LPGRNDMIPNWHDFPLPVFLPSMETLGL